MKLDPSTANTEGQPEKPRSSLPTLSISKQTQLQLSAKLPLPNQAGPGYPSQYHFSQVSAWLKTTQWTTYLRGHNLCQVAELIELPPRLATAPQAALSEHGSHSIEQLHLLLDSFDRVIEQAESRSSRIESMSLTSTKSIASSLALV